MNIIRNRTRCYYVLESKEITDLRNQIKKQEILIDIYEELVSISPNNNKDLDMLKIKCRIAKENILKNTYNINNLIKEFH